MDGLHAIWRNCVNSDIYMWLYDDDDDDDNVTGRNKAFTDRLPPYSQQPVVRGLPSEAYGGQGKVTT